MTRGADRVRLDRVTPDSYLALHAFAVSVDKASAAAGLEPGLLELVRVRASQLNGCGFCLDMHTKQAKAAGETDQRLHTLPAWAETPLFSARERVALALTEAVTLVHDGHVKDEVYAAAAEHYDDAQIAQLLWTIAVINAYNRLAISTRVSP